MTASLAAVDEFPAALRLHAMFLEAADSYRLNQHLLRWGPFCVPPPPPPPPPGASACC